MAEGDPVLAMVFTTTASLLGKPSVLVIFAAASVLLGSAARLLAPHRGWCTTPAVLAAVGLALAVAVTQGRQPFEITAVGFAQCTLTSSSSDSSEVLLNLVMLMPAAFLAVQATRRPLGPVLLCVGASGLAELTQALFNTGGCSGQDLVINSAGVLVAAFTSWALLALTRRRSA